MRSVRSQRACAGFGVASAPLDDGRWQRRFVALAIAASATLRASAPADLFDDIYRRGQPMEQSIKTIRAHFTETTTSSLLVKPVVAEGTLLAVRPSDILLDYTKPEKKLLRIDATTLRFVWPDRKLHETRDIHESQARVQKYFVDKIARRAAPALRHHADRGPGARPGTWRLEMVPKRKQIQQGVTQDRAVDRAAQHDAVDDALTFAGGDTKTMAFTNVEVNAPITLADLGLPSGAAVFRAILRWAHAHRVAVLAAAALLAIASAASLRRLQFDANVLHLLPQDGVAVPAFRDYLERFGSLDYLYVIVDAPDGTAIDDYDETVEALTAAARRHPRSPTSMPAPRDARPRLELCLRSRAAARDPVAARAARPLPAGQAPAQLASTRELLSLPSPEMADLVRSRSARPAPARCATGWPAQRRA